jgi:5,10-methylenetetrahydromethanopterin reductase
LSRIGYGFLGGPKTTEIVNVAKKAETQGFESLWFSETRFTRDAITPLAAMALSTTRAKLGSAAVNVFTRGSVLTAITFATLDELSRGRIIFGIGPGSPLILERQGFGFEGALRRLKEYVEVFRILLRERKADYKGEFVNVKGVSLDFDPPRNEIPVYLAVTGPMALRLAGQIADGVILNGFTSATYAKRAIRLIKEGAEKSGRRTEEIDIASANILSVRDNSRQAKESLRWLVATYLVTFPAIAKESGVSQELLDSIKVVYDREGLENASRLVPYSVIESLTVSGDSDECVARLREYVSAGVKMPIVMPVDSDPELVMKTARKT